MKVSIMHVLFVFMEILLFELMKVYFLKTNKQKFAYK